MRPISLRVIEVTTLELRLWTIYHEKKKKPDVSNYKHGIDSAFDIKRRKIHFYEKLHVSIELGVVKRCTNSFDNKRIKIDKQMHEHINTHTCVQLPIYNHIAIEYNATVSIYHHDASRTYIPDSHRYDSVFHLLCLCKCIYKKNIMYILTISESL